MPNLSIILWLIEIPSVRKVDITLSRLSTASKYCQFWSLIIDD